MAAKLQQAGLFPMKLKRELLKPHSHRVPEALPIGFMLEASNDIVGVSHEDDIASGLSLSPLVGPEIENVVQVDIRKER